MIDCSVYLWLSTVCLESSLILKVGAIGFRDSYSVPREVFHFGLQGVHLTVVFFVVGFIELLVRCEPFSCLSSNVVFIKNRLLGVGGISFLPSFYL